jgi:hypothetical protein
VLGTHRDCPAHGNQGLWLLIANAQVKGAGGLLARQELQADCLAGVWAYRQRRHDWLSQAMSVKTQRRHRHRR